VRRHGHHFEESIVDMTSNSTGGNSDFDKIWYMPLQWRQKRQDRSRKIPIWRPSVSRNGSSNNSAMGLSVCPSVCLSHLWATPKRFKIIEIHFTPHDRVMFLDAKFYGPWVQGFNPNECIKDRCPLSKAQIWPIICNNLERVRDRM